jgi:hypothetical protein
MVAICSPFDGFVQTNPYVLFGDFIRRGPVNSFGSNLRLAHSLRNPCLASSRALSSVLVAKITTSCAIKPIAMAINPPKAHNNVRTGGFILPTGDPHRHYANYVKAVTALALSCAISSPHRGSIPSTEPRLNVEIVRVLPEEMVAIYPCSGEVTINISIANSTRWIEKTRCYLCRPVCVNQAFVAYFDRIKLGGIKPSWIHRPRIYRPTCPVSKMAIHFFLRYVIAVAFPVVTDNIVE